MAQKISPGDFGGTGRACLAIVIASLVACSPLKRTAVRTPHYDSYSQVLAKIAEASPDITLQYLDSVTRDVPIISVRRASAEAPRILIFSAVGGYDDVVVESVLELLKNHIETPALLGKVNLDVIPLLDPFGKGPVRLRYVRQQIESLALQRQGDKYDLVVIHRRATNKIGFSITRLAGDRDSADFLISSFLDRNIVVQTYVTPAEVKRGMKLTHGVFEPDLDSPDNFWGKALKPLNRGAIYALNVPLGEQPEDALSLFLLADQILIKLMGTPR